MEHTPCDCRATERIPTPEELQDDKEAFDRTGRLGDTARMDIEYCPLHYAAPALLEALEAAQASLHTSCLMHNYETPACKQARAAIKAAKGDAK